jgi:hypothetical protein
MGEESDLGGHLPGIAIVAVRCEVADQGTADCSLFCRCDDGSDYAVKDRQTPAGQDRAGVWDAWSFERIRMYLCRRLK